MPAESLPFSALILVGGLGTRLRAVVSDRPKPMALVGKVPFLELLIDSLCAAGVRRFVLLTGYGADAIETHFRNLHGSGTEIAFSREHEPLGTGGAVRNAAGFATDPSLLVNGDTFFDVDLHKLFRYHLLKRGMVTLSLKRVDDVSRYGSVILAEDGSITGFEEKGSEPGGPGLINGGVSLLSKDFILGLPAGVSFSMEREIFPSLAESARMFGLEQDRPFFDIGTPDSYNAFQAYAEKNFPVGNR